MQPKRLVLFVEGKGDVDAVPILVGRLMTDMGVWDSLFLDSDVVRVGGLDRVTGRMSGNWIRFIKVAAKRPRLAGILAILDGDSDEVTLDGERVPFCAAEVAARLARESKSAGGGSQFSVACVFAMREFESWIIAGVESLKGKQLPDGRPGVYAELRVEIPHDTDAAPRDAKRWLRKNMVRGYSPTIDQGPLARIVDLNAIRRRSPRSFVRLESAIKSIRESVRAGNPIISPSLDA